MAARWQGKQQAQQGRPTRHWVEQSHPPHQQQNLLAHDRVVAAVRGLYADRLEPFGRILLRRIRENCAKAAGETEPGSVEGAPLINPAALRKACQQCRQLLVQPLEGKEISVQLKGAPADFVDVTSFEDPFPPALWEQAAAYFDGAGEDDVLLPGGRYVCAQALVARSLPFLRDLSLGEVCHFVQLAISQKRLLGFAAEGGMVPYRHSENYIKERCAATQRPFNHGVKQEGAQLPVADWEQTRACLAYILQAGEDAEAGVTVSNMKRLFRARFGLELSETALGHARLSDLLQDERLQDICKLEARNTDKCTVCRSVHAGSQQGSAWMWGPDAAWQPTGLEGEAPAELPEAAANWELWQQPTAASWYGCDDEAAAKPPPGLGGSEGVAGPPGINGPCMFLPSFPPVDTEWGMELRDGSPMKVRVSEDVVAEQKFDMPEFCMNEGEIIFLKMATELGGVVTVPSEVGSASTTFESEPRDAAESDTSATELLFEVLPPGLAFGEAAAWEVMAV